MSEYWGLGLKSKKLHFCPEMGRVTYQFDSKLPQKKEFDVNFQFWLFFQKLDFENWHFGGSKWLFQKYGMWHINLMVNCLKKKEFDVNFQFWQFFQKLVFENWHFCGLKMFFFSPEVWHVTPHFECGNACKQKITTKIKFFKILFFKKLFFGKFLFSLKVWHVTPRFECHDEWKQKITKIIFRIFFFVKYFFWKNFPFPLKYGMWPLILNVMMDGNRK